MESGEDEQTPHGVTTNGDSFVARMYGRGFSNSAAPIPRSAIETFRNPHSVGASRRHYEREQVGSAAHMYVAFQLERARTGKRLTASLRTATGL